VQKHLEFGHPVASFFLLGLRVSHSASVTMYMWLNMYTYMCVGIHLFMFVRVVSLTVFLKDDRQRFLQKVSKKQFQTVYYNANACG